MIFHEPRWLLGLLLVLLISVWRAFDLKKSRRKLARFVTPDLWDKVIPEYSPAARPRRILLWCLALSFFFTALARPQWGLKEEVIKVTGLDIMVVLDVSNSMMVEDVIPNRMKKAHHVIRSLVERLGGDRVGIVAFAGSTSLACPLTTDHGYVLEVLQTLDPRAILNQGTDIGLALQTANEALERGAEQASAQDGTRVILLVTDGEDLEEGSLEGARAVSRSGVRLFVLGIGTDKGAPIPIRDESGSLAGYKKDSKGGPILSRMNPDALSKVAEAASGRFWVVAPDEKELDELASEMAQLTRTDRMEKRRVTLEERFQVPLALGLVFLFIEMMVSLRKRGSRGPLLLLLLTLVLTSGSNGFAADSVGVYLETKKGVEAFKKGKAEEAKDHFGKAQALDPKKPELLFNQGVSQLNEKDLDSAVQGFSSSAQEALKRGDPGLAGEAFYNLGGALAQKGDTPGAIESFVKGIEAAKASRDEKLETDLRRKIELLQNQQNQKNQNKDDQNKDQSDQKNKDQQSDNNKKDGEGKSGERPQDKEQGSKNKFDNRPKQNSFQSKKLNKEDAERVMNELSEREKDLQGKMRRQKGRPERSEKDW